MADADGKTMREEVLEQMDPGRDRQTVARRTDLLQTHLRRQDGERLEWFL